MKLISLFSKGILWMLLFSITSCATSRQIYSVEELKQIETQKTLTKAAFLQVEPILRRLQPEQPVHTTQLNWAVNSIMFGDKVAGILAVSNGWLGDLSGNVIGAMSKLGAPFAFKDGFIYGQHVYGYIFEPTLFLPKYLVQTKAKVISESEYKSLNTEYKSLNAKKLHGIGWIHHPNEKHKKIFFRDVSIAHAKEITSFEEQYTGYRTGELIKISSSEVEALYGKERYQAVADTVSNLPAGMDLFTMLAKLNGIIAANKGGTQITLFFKGFLNYKGHYRLSKMTLDGIYEVFPFGYVENGQEIPKLALIFKNGVIDKIIPYSSREAVESSLN